MNQSVFRSLLGQQTTQRPTRVTFSLAHKERVRCYINAVTPRNGFLISPSKPTEAIRENFFPPAIVKEERAIEEDGDGSSDTGSGTHQRTGEKHHPRAGDC